MEDFPAIFDQSSGSRRSSPAPVVLRFAYPFPWGKQSLTRLAAFISGHCMFQITITKTYSQGALILWAPSGEHVLNLFMMGYHGHNIYIYCLCNYIYIISYVNIYIYIYTIICIRICIHYNIYIYIHIWPASMTLSIYMWMNLIITSLRFPSLAWWWTYRGIIPIAGTTQ